MIGRMLNYLVQREQKVIRRSMVRLYPDRGDRALAYLATGATELELELFGEGSVLDSVMVTKEEDGWRVESIGTDELEEA